MGSWLGNRCQSLPKTFCKSGLKMLCCEWKAQKSSLTALTAPLEEECDRSGEKQGLYICGHTLYPMQVCSKFLCILSVTNGMDALNSFKNMESNFSSGWPIHVWQDVQHCCPESLIDIWCFGGQGSKGKEEGWPKISNQQWQKKICHVEVKS